MKALLLFTLIYGFCSSAQQRTLDVLDIDGNLQTVQLEAESYENNEYSPSLFMPHVVFPNGDKALLSSRSDMAEVACFKFFGIDVFNPYRDLRISFTEKLSYRRGLFDGVYVIQGKDGEYQEIKESNSDMPIMSVGCSTY